MVNEKGEIILKLTIKVDERWGNSMTHEETIEYLKARFNSSLGFRGLLKSIKEVKQ